MNSLQNYILLLSVIILCCSGCTNVQTETSPLQDTVDDYIKTYQERNDWEKMLSFYSDSIYLYDPNLQYECNGMEEFKFFYNWPDTNFRKFSPEQANLTVEDLMIEGNKAVLRGRFNPFYWQGQLQDWPGGYTIWLFFNEDQKIIQQYDYIIYPPEIIKGLE